MVEEVAMKTHVAHSKALRALARISLTVLAVGCIEDPSTADPGVVLLPDAEQPDADIPDAILADAELPPEVPDAEIFVDAWVEGEVDATPVEADSGVDAEPGDMEVADMAVADAMTEPCNQEDFSDFDSFWACCEEHGFPLGACTPWGPPTPPRFERGLA